MRLKGENDVKRNRWDRKEHLTLTEEVGLELEEVGLKWSRYGWKEQLVLKVASGVEWNKFAKVKGKSEIERNKWTLVKEVVLKGPGVVERNVKLVRH